MTGTKKDKVECQVRHMKRLDAEVSLMDMALYREDGKLEEIRKRTYLKPEAVQEEEHSSDKSFSASYDGNGYLYVPECLFA